MSHSRKKELPFDLICFDLDDTLIPTSYRYHKASFACGTIILRALHERSPRPVNLLEKQVEIDLALVEQMGFCPERFVQSWCDTYIYFAKRAEKKVVPQTLAQIKKTCSQVFEPPFKRFPWTLRVLRLVRRSGYRMHLVTIGDPSIQEQKLYSAGLIPFFPSRDFVFRDKTGALQDALSHDGISPERAVMIGDSPRSDIRPALTLGMHAVHIQSNGWRHGDDDLDGAKVDTLPSIAKLPEWLKKR